MTRLRRIAAAPVSLLAAAAFIGLAPTAASASTHTVPLNGHVTARLGDWLYIDTGSIDANTLWPGGTDLEAAPQCASTSTTQPPDQALTHSATQVEVDLPLYLQYALMKDNDAGCDIAVMTGYGDFPHPAPTWVTFVRPPSAASAVSAVRGSSSSATITWSTPALSGRSAITGYRVSRDGRDTGGSGAYSKVVSASTRSFTMSHLVTGATYHLSVQPINAIGSAPQVTVTVPGAVSVLGAAGAVNVRRTADTSASISWAAPSHLGGKTITGYRVSRDNGAYATTLAASVRSFTFTRLSEATQSTFTVSPLYAGGSGPGATGSVFIG